MTNTRQFFSTQIFAFSAPKWRSARLRFSASSLQICHCLRALFSLKVDPHRMWHTLRRPLEKWTKNFKNAAPAFARGKIKVVPLLGIFQTFYLYRFECRRTVCCFVSREGFCYSVFANLDFILLYFNNEFVWKCWSKLFPSFIRFSFCD